MQTLHVYAAPRYAIGVRTPTGSRKAFQVGFAKDGSMFVAFPYYRSGAGRLGLVHLDATLTYPTNLTVGENFPATSHYVKYSHHPSGRAHFSLTGKVTPRVGKHSAALHHVNGHLFTVMLQGLDYFEPVSPNEKGTAKRGLAIFPFEREPVAALKFVGMLYSERQLARIVKVNSPTPWFNVISPDGIRKFGIVLASSVVHGGEKYYLLLTAQRLATICADQEVFISLLGGFDAPNIALDHTKPTSFLMFIYPSSTDFKELVQQFGTVDLS